MIKSKHIYIAGLITLICYSCSVKKYIPEGQLLYRGGTITLPDSLQIQQQSELEEQLHEVLYPQPNAKFLGMYVRLYYHYKAQREHPGVLNKWLNKKLGEEPVYLSDVNLETTEKVLQNRLENNGFFYSDVEYVIKRDTLNKTATIAYDVSINKPYVLRQYKVETDSTDTLAIYNKLKASLAESDLKIGTRFQLSDLKAERERIDAYLKERGYYYFSDDFLLFEADTNRYNDRGMDLYLKFKEGIPKEGLLPFVLDSVQVYSNVVNDSVYGTIDTVRVEDVDIIQGDELLMPKRLEPFVLLRPGQLYSPTISKYTSRRLSSIGTYKFVNIYYRQRDTLVDSLGRRHMNSVITLSPYPKNAFQLRLQGVTKSNDFTGPNLEASFTNRNIFKGGENLQVKAKVGYEKQLSNESGGDASSLHLGLETSILFPRMLFPGKFEKAFRYSIPKTKVSVGVDYLNRSNLYSLNSFSTSFGYIWQQNRYVTHTVNPIKIDYVKLGHTSQRFEDILDENPFLRRSFEQQFIAGTTYSFTYNELNQTAKKGELYFKFNFDIAGNTANLFGKDQSDGTRTFLGLKYAQYVKGDIDVSYHYKLDKKGNILVGHLFAGLGIPYGNSTSLPFVKQYFAGGPYSVRAFRIRSLGPGSYKPAPNTDSYFDQAGDIRLEANVEYRFPIFSILKGALFFDAGNVWLMKENPALPGGEFSSNFLSEMGVGTGFGLRIDVQGFVVRFDLAAPLKKPAEKWDFEYNKPVFNFAIGYPF